MKPVVPKPQRCAIYTRKSSEHNLDLEFNSLDAQREACEAYIKSQAQEGWRLVLATRPLFKYYFAARGPARPPFPGPSQRSYFLSLA